MLQLTTQKLLERRLQTKVFKQGLAKSIHHARVLIKQRHIRVGKQLVNVPSFLVRVDSEKHIQFGESPSRRLAVCTAAPAPHSRSQPIASPSLASPPPSEIPRSQPRRRRTRTSAGRAASRGSARPPRPLATRARRTTSRHATQLAASFSMVRMLTSLAVAVAYERTVLVRHRTGALSPRVFFVP